MSGHADPALVVRKAVHAGRPAEAVYGCLADSCHTIATAVVDAEDAASQGADRMAFAPVRGIGGVVVSAHPGSPAAPARRLVDAIHADPIGRVGDSGDAVSPLVGRIESRAVVDRPQLRDSAA